MYKDIIGLPALIDLAKWRGGRWIRVPKLAIAGSKLADAIGSDAAKRLSDIYGGELIRPPKCLLYLLGVRNAEMYELHYPCNGVQAVSLDALAEKYGLTQSGVLMALNRHKQRNKFNKEQRPSPQQSLF